MLPALAKAGLSRSW